MPAKKLIGLLLVAATLAPVVAQTTTTSTTTTTTGSGDATGRTPAEEYQRGYAATPMPNQAAINAGGAPGTAALNNQVTPQASANAAAVEQYQASQAEYDADRLAYMDALAKHDAAVDRTDARYVRQQTAYADAMRVWRAQVWACKHGHPRACNLPAPNPAAFY